MSWNLGNKKTNGETETVSNVNICWQIFGFFIAKQKEFQNDLKSLKSDLGPHHIQKTKASRG